MKHIHFAVIGSGRFPVDMLRYDCCYPSDSLSASKILTDETDRATRQRRVVFLSAARESIASPTWDRWSSFGWSVICCGRSDAAVRDEVRASDVLL